MSLGLTKKMRQSLVLTGAGLALAFANPAFAQLSKAEAKMAATVDSEYERSVALLERMVNQNSGTLNFDGVRKIADIMRAELEPMGVTVWSSTSNNGTPPSLTE